MNKEGERGTETHDLALIFLLLRLRRRTRFFLHLALIVDELGGEVSLPCPTHIYDVTPVSRQVEFVDEQLAYAKSTHCSPQSPRCPYRLRPPLSILRGIELTRLFRMRGVGDDACGIDGDHGAVAFGVWSGLEVGQKTLRDHVPDSRSMVTSPQPNGGSSHQSECTLVHTLYTTLRILESEARGRLASEGKELPMHISFRLHQVLPAGEKDTKSEMYSRGNSHNVDRD